MMREESDILSLIVCVNASELFSLLFSLSLKPHKHVHTFNYAEILEINKEKVFDVALK